MIFGGLQNRCGFQVSPEKNKTEEKGLQSLEARFGLSCRVFWNSLPSKLTMGMDIARAEWGTSVLWVNAQPASKCLFLGSHTVRCKHLIAEYAFQLDSLGINMNPCVNLTVCKLTQVQNISKWIRSEVRKLCVNILDLLYVFLTNIHF